MASESELRLQTKKLKRETAAAEAELASLAWEKMIVGSGGAARAKSTPFVMV